MGSSRKLAQGPVLKLDPEPQPGPVRELELATGLELGPEPELQ